MSCYPVFMQIFRINEHLYAKIVLFDAKNQEPVLDPNNFESH